MTSSLACGILWRFGAIIPAPRSSVKNAMAGDAHAQLRTLCWLLLPTAWSACAVSG